MAWADIVKDLDAAIDALKAMPEHMPQDTRMTAEEHAAILTKAAAVFEAAGDLRVDAETWRPLSQHEQNKAAIARITDQKDCAKTITKDAKGRETMGVVSSKALDARVEIATVYDDAKATAERTVTAYAKEAG